MAEFTFDELTAPKEFTFEELTKPKEFSFDELSKPQLPQFDAASAQTPESFAADLPPKAQASPQGWKGEGMGFGMDDPIVPLGDLLVQNKGGAPGYALAKAGLSAISPKAGALAEGAEETAKETLNGLATPKNLALMLGSLGVASTGVNAARLVSGLWTALGAKTLAENAPRLLVETKHELDKPEPDYKKVGENMSELGVDTLFTVAPAAHLASSFIPEGSQPRFQVQDRGETLQKMADAADEARQTELTGQAPLNLMQSRFPVKMGLEQSKIPDLGVAPTFEPSGLKLAQEAVKPEYKGGIELELAEELRNTDFSKAVAEKVLQEHEPPIHPEKPLTENQLRIIRDSLTQAIADNQIPGVGEKGLIRGSALEKWADETIRTAGQKYYTGGMVELTAAALVKGAALLEKGVTEFSKWSAEMVKEFGDKIRPHIRQIYLQSTEERGKAFKSPEAKQTAPNLSAPSAPNGLQMAGAPSPVPATVSRPPTLPSSAPPPLPQSGTLGVTSKLGFTPQDVRERFNPIARQDSPAVARGFTETVQSGPRARTIIGDFLRTNFGKNKSEQERLAKDFVALGWDNRRIEMQGRGIQASQVPALTPQERARIQSDPKIQAAVTTWNREIAPAITEIRQRNNMLMSQNWNGRDLMLNLPSEYDPTSQAKSGVNTSDVYNKPAIGEGSLQSDPVEALNQIVRGHLRYDASQTLANAIRRDVSIPPNTVIDPKQRANPATFPSPRTGENFEAPYKGKMTPVKAIDLDPTVGDYHYVPLRVADAWEHQHQDRSVYGNWWDKVRGVAISGGLLPASFLPHVYREVTAVAARIAQSGQSMASALPSWLGSNEYALYRMNQMRETRYGQLMQRLVDRTGSDRGSGFVDEPTSKIGKAINKPHDILFNPDYGIDVMARRTIMDAALIKRFGVKALRALEKSVNDGTSTVQQGMKVLESKLNDSDMLSVGREVNNTMGWGNTQTRSTSLNWAQRLLPFVSSESGKIPDEIRRFTTLNLDIPSMAKSVKRGEYEQTAKQMAASLANGAIGIYGLMTLANFALTKALTGQGKPISDNPEGRRTDIQIANGWYLGNLDPGLSRAARITGAKDLANSKGHEAPDIGRELINESFSVLDPTVRWLFVASSLLAGNGKTLYLNQKHELGDARKSDLIPFAPLRNLLNTIGSKKEVKPAAIKDAAQMAGIQLLDEPPSPEAIEGAKRNAAIDSIARKAKLLPRDERKEFVREQLDKRGYWDSKARARLGRMYPGLYKYED